MDGGSRSADGKKQFIGDMYPVPLTSMKNNVIITSIRPPSSRTGSNQQHTAGLSRSSDAACC